jgi:hypothetical protein
MNASLNHNYSRTVIKSIDDSLESKFVIRGIRESFVSASLIEESCRPVSGYTSSKIPTAYKPILPSRDVPSRELGALKPVPLPSQDVPSRELGEFRKPAPLSQKHVPSRELVQLRKPPPLPEEPLPEDIYFERPIIGHRMSFKGILDILAGP